MKMKKYFALLLAAALMLGCATGCGGSTPPVTENAVMDVDGYKVGFDEFMYYLYYASTTLTSYYNGGSFEWDGMCTYDKSITNAQWCVNEALYMGAQTGMIINKAKELGAEMTEEQLKELDESIDDYVENYAESGQGSFDDALRAEGMTRETFRILNITNASLSNVFTATYGENGEKLDDAAFEKYVEDNGYMTSAHILFAFSENVTKEDGTTESVEISDGKKAEKKAKAEEISAELRAITDPEQRKTKFFEYMNELSEDPGKVSNPEGYTFTEGVMVQEYTDASKALGDYEVSDVVESSFGYHVIMGLPTTKTCIDTRNQYGYTVGLIAASYAFDVDMKNWNVIEKAEFTEAFKDFDFTQFFTDQFNFTTWAEFSAQPAAAPAPEGEN